ncbi:MAG: ferritin [Bacillota bacterium]
MLSQEMNQLLNRLIQLELYSAYLYLAIANYFHRLNLTGMAEWLRQQHEEEREHAQRLISYVNDLNGVVEIRGIPEMPVNFGSPLQAWQQVLEHERYVTQSYQEAYGLALRAQDYQTAAQFDWFLREQVDEIAQSTRIVGRLQLSQGNPAALLLLDQEMGQRAG